MNNPLAQKINLSSLLKFALPTIIMMLFMGLYTIIDTIFVSRFVNTDALSAINIVCPVINIIVGISTMLATGSSAIIAKKMGENNYYEANQNFTMIIIAGIIIAISITLSGIIFIDKIIWGLGASEQLFKYCKDYLFTIILFTPASFLQILFQSLIITAGKPNLGLILSISAGIINIVFDYLFIVPLNMGIMGSAIATGLGYLSVSLVGIYFFSYGKGTLKFVVPKFNHSVLIKSCTNGASEMVSQLATAITTFLFNLIMMELAGENGVAAITIIIYSQFLLTTFYIGYSMGIAPIISYNCGSKNHDNLKKLSCLSTVFILSSSLIIFLLAFIFGKNIVSIFVQNNLSVSSLAKNGFVIFAFSFLFSGFNIFASAFFTALSNGRISALISFSRTFVFILLTLFTLPKLFHTTGVWLAIPIAEILTVLLVIYLLIKYKKYYHY